MAKRPEDKLLKILQHVPVPIVIASPFTGKILWVNPPLVAMYGSESEAEIVGSSLLDFIQAPQLAKALADLARVATGDSPAPVTYELRKHTGEFAAGQVSSIPMFLDSQPAMLSFVTDVSEREWTVRQLAESEDRYRSLLANLTSGVVVEAIDGTIQYANEALATALGVSSNTDLVGRMMRDFICESERDNVEQARRTVLDTGVRHPAGVMRLFTESGEQLPTTASTTRILWDGALATQTVMHDIGMNCD
ncbi:MAG: PAS domain S-box protein [Coriobacteriia bacterium]|nr:PAS domain S-box protein [Coriobacteriia bacterium]